MEHVTEDRCKERMGYMEKTLTRMEKKINWVFLFLFGILGSTVTALLIKAFELVNGK
jgi:hypothetical protein